MKTVDDAATVYARRVVAGKVIAGKLVRLACQRHLDDLKMGQHRGLHFDIAAADRAIRFFSFLKHSKGEWVGRPFVLAPWECFIIGSIFGWKREDGTRRYRQAYNEVARKNGKALALDTPIPTPHGWAMIGDLRIGDRVFDERGEVCAVTGVTQIKTNRPCYEMEFSDGERIVADAEHEWLTTARANQPGIGGRPGYKHGQSVKTRVRTTREIARTQKYGARGDCNHSVSLAAPLRLPDAILPIDPYVLGAWLGDGHTAAARLTCSYEDDQILEKIRAAGVIARAGKSSSSGSGSYHLGSPAGRGHSLQATLRDLGVLGQKNIPPVYLRGSVRQRLALLQGLMDTAGYVSRVGQCEFTTTTATLCEGLRELVASLGFKATVKMGRAMLYGKDCGPKYRVMFFAPAGVPVFRLDRKSERQRTIGSTARSRTRQIVAVRPIDSVRVRCIEVDSPSRLYLTGRAMIPTHNSTLSAGVGLLLFAADDEPGAEIYTAATKRDQARITHSEATRMVRKSSALRRRIRIFHDNLSIEETASKYEPLGADADTADGLNVHGALIDELHAHKTRDLVDVLETSIAARRQPLIFEITTAGMDHASICREHHDYSTSVLNGTIQDDSWFAYIAALDQKDSWKNPKVWIKANPNLGVSVKLDDLRRQCERARRMPAALNAVLNKRLNVWTQQVSRWIDPTLWDENQPGRHLAIDEANLVRRKCYGMLDLATVSDMTAWVMLFPCEGDPDAVDILARFFCPQARLNDSGNRYRDQYRIWARQGWLTTTPGEATDYAFVRAQVVKDAQQFQLVDMNVDRLFQAHQIAGELMDEGITVLGFGMGFVSFAAPMVEFERLLMARKLHHGHNPILRWMADNVAVKTDPAGNLKPDKASSQGKIDGIVGVVGALDRLMRHQGKEVLWRAV